MRERDGGDGLHRAPDFGDGLSPAEIVGAAQEEHPVVERGTGCGCGGGICDWETGY